MKTISRIEIVTTQRRVVIRCGEQLEHPGNDCHEDAPAQLVKQIHDESNSTERMMVLREAVRILTECIDPE